MRGLKALLITVVTLLAVATPTALSQRDHTNCSRASAPVGPTGISNNSPLVNGK